MAPSSMESWLKNANLQQKLPKASLDGLAPADVYLLLQFPFEAGSPLRYSPKIELSQLEHVPFLMIIVELLDKLQSSGPISLTATGSLPRKICLELYGSGLLPEEHIEAGISKLSKEGDSIVLQNIRLITLQSGLAKKRKGKLSLTRKGKELMDKARRLELFTLIFNTYAFTFNWAYHDAYWDEKQIQETFGFLMYLFLTYGSEWHSPLFYAQKHIRAFPGIATATPPAKHAYTSLEDYYAACIQVRFFERFISFFGGMESRIEVHGGDRSPRIRSTELFRSLFTLDTSSLQINQLGRS